MPCHAESKVELQIHHGSSRITVVQGRGGILDAVVQTGAGHLIWCSMYFSAYQFHVAA